jgi:thioesterase domain-containing protein
MQIAKGPDRAPFFWVHGVGGEVFSYMQVSKHLARARPVYGFAADWTKVFKPEDRRIDRIAARYIDEMMAVQPTGPYHLGGFCSAAVLVLEMASQLEARGQEIGAFAILDYDVLPSDAKSSSFQSVIAFARNLPRWVQEDAMPSGPMELLGRVRSRLRRGLSPAPAEDGDIRDAIGMWRFPDYQVEMLRVHHEVIHSFTPGPINGHVTLFLPRTGPLFGPWPVGPDPDWDTIARGGVNVVLVRGSHSTMLIEPFAAELAEQLNHAITAAEERLTPAAHVELSA